MMVRLLALWVFLAGALPAHAADGSANDGKAAAGPLKKDAGKVSAKPGDKEKKESPKAETKPGARAEPAPAGASSAAPSPPPPTSNLEISGDIDEKARKSLEEAIGIYKEAMEAGKGKGALIDKAVLKLKLSSVTLSKSPLPLYYLGIAYQLKRNFPEAKRVLERAVKLNPRFHEAFLELGDVGFHQQDLKAALAAYDKAIALNPSYASACLNKAKALIRLGQYQDAKPYLDQVEKQFAKKGPNEKDQSKTTTKKEGNGLDEAAEAEEKKDLQAKDPEVLRIIMEQRYLSRKLAEQIKGPPWSTTFTSETRNYVVKTCVSQEFANEISQRAELIHKAYDKVFPSIEKPKRKFPILVYPDMESYMRAGSPPGTGGYYDTFFRKLVLFRMPRKEVTISVLQHEALHQYLDDYLAEAPQWFNEGMGDYFAGFEYVKNGKDERMIPRAFRERLPDIKRVVMFPELCVPSPELMAMTQAEFYEPKMRGYHYAQAWGMIYYIGESEKYKPVLLAYFKALQKGADINDAYSSTFGKLDMARFDQEWKTFIKGLK